VGGITTSLAVGYGGELQLGLKSEQTAHRTRNMERNERRKTQAASLLKGARALDTSPPGRRGRKKKGKSI